MVLNDQAIGGYRSGYGYEIAMDIHNSESRWWLPYEYSVWEGPVKVFLKMNKAVVSSVMGRWSNRKAKHAN